MRTYYKMSCGDHVELLEHYLERSRHTANNLRYLWCSLSDEDIVRLINTITDAEHQIKAIKKKWWPDKEVTNA